MVFSAFDTFLIKFCNYFSDIDYENIIDKKYLPIDFNAKSGNPTRRAFEEGKLRKK